MGITVIKKDGGSGSSSGLQGTWDASTNTPTLANTDTDKTGFMYQVSVGGTVDFGAGNITFEAKDIVINNGTVWDKVDATDAVISVNSNTGVVVLDADDIDDTSTTNKFTTASDISKLSGIEAGADVTDATNVDSAGATMNTDTDVSGNSWVLDEDNMLSNSATKLPTQQSVKAYVDNNAGGGTEIYTLYNPSDIGKTNSATFSTVATVTLPVGIYRVYYNLGFYQEVSASGVRIFISKTSGTISALGMMSVLSSDEFFPQEHQALSRGSTTNIVNFDYPTTNTVITNGHAFGYSTVEVTTEAVIVLQFSQKISNPGFLELKKNSGATFIRIGDI